MREIKFRAWFGGKSNTGMLYSSNLGLIKFFENWLYIQHKLKVIMQFAGLKDKKGAEVYEGDIVRGDTFVGVVKLLNFSWQVHRLDADGEVEEWFIINDYKFEVIGNVYENRKMLISPKDLHKDWNKVVS